ncbi:hypothetical protein VaNZ11_015810 [Volvox africanus]|uniref:Cilia- and flagella-associated protein 61 N-terminal domain-containing protein n=1 Tax=Volvox africanus TaxID=51714 RepID=A0ABQ5SNT6_9CHLO|nr:hypothetical protein VaNZ11_015810 [Volvox africanus]
MEFNSSQAALRIRRVQLLCVESGLDGVLFVPGVDGRFSVCNQAMGYLFAGRSNRDTIDVVKLDDQLENAVVLITPTEVKLHVPDAEMREQLQALLVPHVTSFRILGPTITEAADPDLLEENKLASFVHMLRGCRRLGVPCNLAPPPSPSSASALGHQHAQKGSPASNGAASPQSAAPKLGAEQLLALEQWPLLQAYGLEGVGRSGFFTMNFQVYDVQPYMQLLYGNLDGRSLEVLVSEAVPTLRQHWDEMLQALGGKAAGQRSGLSERQVAEPLSGFFAYGLLRAVNGVEQSVTLPPRVIFGPRSSEDSARSEALPLARCGPRPPNTDSPAAEAPLHMVVEAADPRSPLRVARTYFLARGHVVKDVFADPDEEAEEGYSFDVATAGWRGPSEEVVMMMRTYTALVEAARASMSHFATVEGATALSAKAVALEVLSRSAEQLGVSGVLGAGGGGGSPLASRLRFILIQMDHVNRVTAPAVRGSRQLKILRLSLPDIAVRSSAGSKLLGGLVYGDTFLEIPPSYTSSEGEAAGTGVWSGKAGGSGWRLLVLTEGVPSLEAIPAGGCEEQLAARALRSLSRVVEGGAGAAASLRTAALASQRDFERRAAAAAAESQALAARLRERRLGTPSTAEGAGDVEDLEDNDAEAEEEAVAAAAAAAASAPASLPLEAMGRLLTLGGGDEAVLLTGAPSCPALSGTLYCFSAGLVFVEAVSRALWVLDLRGGVGEGLEAVTMQQLPFQQQPAARRDPRVVAEPAATPVATSRGLGEAVVFRGTTPACGLPPVCHLTSNTHVALPLEAMSPAARRFLIQSVLPAWNQTCREAATAATESRSETHRSPVSYFKDMDAPNPFPAALHRAHTFAIQSSAAGGAVKTWSAIVADDDAVRSAIEGLDAEELRGLMSGLDPSVEALLLQPPLPGAAATAAPGGAVTLVVGLPGADQVSVAAAIASMLEEEVGPPGVALLPPAGERLREEHFEVALERATAMQLSSRRQQQPHLVIATSSYLGLMEQLRMLAAAAVGGAAGRWRLAAVVVCVSDDVSYEEPGRSAIAGGLLAQLLPGFVDCVVVGGSNTAKVSELSESLSHRLPEVPQVRSSRTQLLRARAELLPPRADRATRLSSQRAMSAREAWAPIAAAPSAAAATGGLLGPLCATRVVFEGSLDVALLRDALVPLGIPQDPRKAPRLPLGDKDEDWDRRTPVVAANTDNSSSSLVCVSGCVRLSQGAGVSELQGSRQVALRVKEWPLRGDIPLVMGSLGLPANGKAPGGELLFVGSGPTLESERLRALLERCGTSANSAAASVSAAADVVATAAQLTAAQRAAIRAAHLWDPLPEGYCFNGTQYFDAFGDASLEHPYMARFISEWWSDQRAKEVAREAQRESERGAVRVVRVSSTIRL